MILGRSALARKPLGRAEELGPGPPATGRLPGPLAKPLQGPLGGPI